MEFTCFHCRKTHKLGHEAACKPDFRCDCGRPLFELLTYQHREGQKDPAKTPPRRRKRRPAGYPLFELTPEQPALT